MIRNMIIGMVANRVRGTKFRIYFLGQDDINALLFAAVFSQTYWHLPILWLGMKLGSATGWSEFVGGCRGEYEKPNPDGDTWDLTWISKFINIKNQWTTFLWGNFRALIWIAALQLAFLACGQYTNWLWAGIPLFYATYRGAYLLAPKKDTFEMSEPIWGAILWGLCSLGGMQ